MTARSSSGSWSGAPHAGGADIIDLDRYMRGTRPARRPEQMHDRLVVDAGLAGARKTAAPALSMHSSCTAPTARSVGTALSAPSSATESGSARTGSARSGGDADKRFSHDSGLSDTSYARRPPTHRPHRGRSGSTKLAPVEKVRSRASSASLRAFRAALERALRDQQEQISRVARLCERQAERRSVRRFDKSLERGTKRGSERRSDRVEPSTRADNLERSSRADHLVERSSRADHLVERSSRADHLVKRSSRADHLVKGSSRADHLVKRSSRADHLVERSSRADHLERSSRADQLERATRAELAERATRADLAERAKRAEQPERSKRAEHAERSKRAEHAERSELSSGSTSDSDLSSSSRTTDPGSRDKHRSPDCKTYKIIMNKLDELNRVLAARKASPPPAPPRPSPAPAPRAPPARRDSSGSVTVSDKVVATDFPQPPSRVSARGASCKRLVERGAGGESKLSASSASGAAGGAAVGANTRVITCALSLDIPPINVTSAARGSSEEDGSGGGSDPSVLRGRYDLDDPVHLYAQAKRLQAMHETTRRARSADAPRSTAPGSGVTGLGSATREVSLCALCRAYWRLARRCLTAPLGAMRAA